jgi:hypothetical protein
LNKANRTAEKGQFSAMGLEWQPSNSSRKASQICKMLRSIAQSSQGLYVATVSCSGLQSGRSAQLLRAARRHSASQHNYYVLKSLYTLFAVSAIDFDQAATQLYLLYSAEENYGAKRLFDSLVFCCAAANLSINIKVSY